MSEEGEKPIDGPRLPAFLRTLAQMIEDFPEITRIDIRTDPYTGYYFVDLFMSGRTRFYRAATSDGLGMLRVTLQEERSGQG